ncbi:IclR family transcriptional regulator [Halomarina halobia]|uniref:IclR family transcriptional regulator n=1 Tax=Halomarina halobia TaxID=3033386 RepID=A0ABD6AE13_9EURY|nr:IclR family transcriptional regulator [Halomarina sp. PSR21]
MDDTADGGNSPRTIEAVDKTCRIVEAVHELGGAGVTELAERLDISKGTIHTHLATLSRNGFIVKDGDTYRVSLRFLDIGEDAKIGSQIYQVARPEIRELAEQTNTRTQITIEEFGMVVVLAIERGEHTIPAPTRIGKRDYMHCIASGKAILAHLPEERVRRIVRHHGLPARTPNTIVDEDDLMGELAEIRDRGYAYNDEEKIKGLRAVGVTIRNDSGTVLGAVSASGATSKMKGSRYREEIPEALLSVANTIEFNIRVEEGQFETSTY